MKHKPLLVGDRGEPIGAYALVKLKNGAEYFKWMSREELEKRQKRSPSAQMGNSPWNHEDDRLKMWQKTCIIELQKVIPKASENMQRLNQAAELEARAEAGKRQDFGDVFDVDASEIDPDGVPVDDEDELDAVASKLEGQEDNGNGKEPEPEPKQEATPNEAEPVQAELVEDKPEAEAETKAEENESGLSGKALENLREDVKHCAQNLLEREIISEDDWYEITSDAGCASGNVKNMTGDQLRAVEKALQAELAASQRKGNKKQKATAGAK